MNSLRLLLQGVRMRSGPCGTAAVCATGVAILFGCAAPEPVPVSDPCVAYVAPAFADAADSARGRVTALVAREPMPGAAVAVVVDGTLVWSEGFGSSDLASAVPVCRDTGFRTGSVSKVLTGSALLRMSDAGEIDLDTDVRALVTEVAHQPHRITLRQLAGHLGGIRHYGAGEYFNTRRYDRVVDALGIFAPDSLQSVPGTAYLYSSYGYNLLGAALAVAAGTPYAQVVRQSVLDPLELRHTTPEPEAPAGAIATPYSADADSLVPSPPVFDPSDRIPSGGWISSAEDVATLGAALLDPTFLSAESRELIFTSQRTAEGVETGYSMGLRLGVDAAGRPIAHHGGTSIGARAFLLIYPEEGVSVAILANGPATYDEEDVAHIVEPFFR